MIFRAINGVMALLFAFAALLQYNDPDPVRWMAIYTAAMLVAAWVGVRGVVPVVAPLLVAIVALAWGLFWSTDVSDWATYTHMFDSWEMKNVPVEEARETGGLLIVTGWMAVVGFWIWRQKR